MELKTRNVNTAFNTLVTGITDGTIRTWLSSSRNGPVIQVAEPVLITYERPLERVLFNSYRDANPFMHLYESLWMLVGRNDVAPLVYYAKQFAEYSDDGLTLNGAYGYRWRRAKARSLVSGSSSFDQLDLIVEHLNYKPDSRRAVLQMWNVQDDLLRINYGRDVCCNLSVMFALREQCGPTVDRCLDMTVTNRSNDLIWGMLGANVVHFSILQEYMAARLGVRVGLYHHFTNNLHAYQSNWHPEKWLSYYNRDLTNNSDWYSGDYCRVPLVGDSEEFDRELPEFVERHREGATAGSYTEPFLESVAQPMLLAYHAHKNRNTSTALDIIEQVQADDWRIAGREWLQRRRK